MDLLFELIFSIIFEGSIEGMKSKKIPLWIRIICTIMVVAIFSFVISIIGLLAVAMWNEYHHIPSVLLSIVDLLFIIFGIKKVKKLKMNLSN